MKITEERMGQLLPQNILDSELSLASKKVLAAMLDWYQNSEAKQTKIVIISNKVLCSIAGVGGDSLQQSLRELNDYGLVTRTIGTKLGDASKYVINFKKLLQPLKRMGFEEMFSEELETTESLEKPISTIVENSIVECSIDKSSIDKCSIDDDSTVESSTVDDIVDDCSIEKERTEHNTVSDTESTYTIKDFMKEVDETFVGESEDELLEQRISLSSKLSKRRIEIGENLYKRCNSYLNRKYDELVASIASTASVEELPF